MQKQEIKNVDLVLMSNEGIKPIQEYAGKGFLTKDSKGFHFTENKRYTRVRNSRIAKLGEGTYMMYEPKTGMYRMQLYLKENELNQKAIIEKAGALLKEGRERKLI